MCVCVSQPPHTLCHASQKHFPPTFCSECVSQHKKVAWTNKKNQNKTEKHYFCVNESKHAVRFFLRSRNDESSTDPLT